MSAADYAPLIITNAISLGETVNREYFGSDITLAFTRQVNLTCLVSDMYNTSGPISVASLIALRDAQDWRNVTISGKNYGKCRITSFNLVGGTNAYVATCNITFESRSSGTSSGGTYFADMWRALNSDGKLIESISETSSLSRGENSTSFSREVSIKLNNASLLFSPQTGATSTLGKAKEMVRAWVKDGADYVFPIISGEYDSIVSNKLAKKKFYTEKVDAINGTVSITESLDTSNIVSDVYSHSYTIQLNVGEDGIVTVSESGSVEGLGTNRAADAETGYAAVIPAANARCQAVYGLYGSSAVKCEKTISSRARESSKKVDIFSGKIDYSITFDDNDANKGSVYKTVTTSIVQNGCVSSADVSYTFEGTTRNSVEISGGTLSYPKYAQALAAFENVASGIEDIISDQNYDNLPISRSETHKLYQGVIEGSLSFSSNDLYRFNTTTDKIKKFDEQTSATLPVIVTKSFTFVPTEFDSGNTVVQQADFYTDQKEGYQLSMTLARIAPSNDITRYAALTGMATGFSGIMDSISVSYAPLNDATMTVSVDTTIVTDEECEDE